MCVKQRVASLRAGPSTTADTCHMTRACVRLRVQSDRDVVELAGVRRRLPLPGRQSDEPSRQVQHLVARPLEPRTCRL